MMAVARKQQALALIAEKKRRLHAYRYRTMYREYKGPGKPGLYDWQIRTIAETKNKRAVCLMCGNQVGKTFTGTYIDAIHLIGDYPDVWPGYKFESPPLIWLLGYSGEKTRDLLQTALFGRMEGRELSGGLVPKDLILHDQVKSMSGTTGALREVPVRHKSGGVSICQFWSYSQGQHALMGDIVDWYHVDEEPKDAAIYPQVITRTLNGDHGRGGRGILTFTPENGRTDLVIQFMDNPTDDQAFIQVGWNAAPHMSDDMKASMLAQYPAYQRDMRSKGVPMLGHGRIYDVSEEFISCEPMQIPDHWFVINGMDFGWTHPQAHVQLLWDKDSDTFYVTQAWKRAETSSDEAWGAVKPWAKGVPVSWPHDGEHPDRGGYGVQQKQHYANAGFKMLLERAQWPDKSISVESGLYEINNLMRKGRWKVFRGLRDYFDEHNQYHRNDKGQIVKVRDDLMDAVRYAYMMRRFAIRYGDRCRDEFAQLEAMRESAWQPAVSSVGY